MAYSLSHPQPLARISFSRFHTLCVELNFQNENKPCLGTPSQPPFWVHGGCVMLIQMTGPPRKEDTTTLLVYTCAPVICSGILYPTTHTLPFGVNTTTFFAKADDAYCSVPALVLTKGGGNRKVRHTVCKKHCESHLLD